MDYENLVSELVHLCKATPGGLPYFTMPTEAVARIMSRDDGLVGLVKGLQGAQADSKLRRALRAGDYAGAAAVVVRGYGFWLQNLEKEASGAVVLQQLHDNLSKLPTAGASRWPRISRGFDGSACQGPHQPARAPRREVPREGEGGGRAEAGRGGAPRQAPQALVE